MKPNADYCRYGVCKWDEPHMPWCTEYGPRSVIARLPEPNLDAGAKDVATTLGQISKIKPKIKPKRNHE